ncbi:MAG: hypothetical protein EXR80_10155 [Methylococcales bacterium]|nr:hypothetical protein [Methylococcales bacterium]
MTTKNNTATKPRNTVNVSVGKDENRDDKVAKVFTSPSVQAALTIQEWEGDVYEFNSLNKALSLQIDEVNNGNMKRPEAILLAQAHTLDELFNNLARRAHKMQSLKRYEMNLRLALKAQSQCRATLETLAAIKNPPVIFAKQANISNGHQQINNGVPATHTEKTKNQPNEL